MRRFFKSLSIFLLSTALVCPVAEGRGRNNNNGANNPPSHQTARPSHNHGAQRPGSQGQRPGNNHNNNHGTRPGNNRPGGQRPGNNRPGGQRPGNNFGPSHRPDHRPDYGHRPPHGFGPGPGGPSWSHLHYGAPHRPMMPPPRPYRRPVPPPWFHYHHGGPSLSTILGITFGTAISATINSLLNRGFAVTGYSNDAVYINNVTQLNLLWPSATLFYNSTGGLTASEFLYFTPYYDMGRYNMAYRSLMNFYGAPVAVNQISGGGMQANWWGANGQFISLTFGPQYASNGSLQYYTTLSFGN